ncbi:MAG: hypothetical protein M5U22_17910 [Thermoleophilia bacterium]|nr:hypothetical protein [Thermoleophilia bacterium]
MHDAEDADDDTTSVGSQMRAAATTSGIEHKDRGEAQEAVGILLDIVICWTSLRGPTRGTTTCSLLVPLPHSADWLNPERPGN